MSASGRLGRRGYQALQLDFLKSHNHNSTGGMFREKLTIVYGQNIGSAYESSGKCVWKYGPRVDCRESGMPAGSDRGLT